jgi:hypothetical protein
MRSMSIDAAVLIGSPGFLIAPRLKIGLAAPGRIFPPCRFERRARG